MRPLPSSSVRIGYEERKGVLLCLEDVILSVADTVAVVADTAAVVKWKEAAAVQHFA